MIESIAYKLAVSLKNRVPNHPSSTNVFKFTIAALINTVAIIAFTIGVSLITKRTEEAFIILISFALLRIVSGGIHLKSGDKCVVVTTSLFTLISMISLDANLIFVLNGVSIVLAFLYAPSRLEKQSKIDPKHYPKLRVLSILIIATNFLFVSSVIAVTFFVQSMLLIKRKGVSE